jgi:hypothetical protein
MYLNLEEKPKLYSALIGYSDIFIVCVVVNHSVLLITLRNSNLHNRSVGCSGSIENIKVTQ